MATTTAQEPEAAAAAVEASTAQLRHVPLSGIVIPEGFNPRGEVADDAQLDHLAETIRRHGCLQPIRVRETAGGGLELDCRGAQISGGAQGRAGRDPGHRAFSALWRQR